MRTYTYKFKCPYCGKPYAKKTLWIRHIKGCQDKKEVNPS